HSPAGQVAHSLPYADIPVSYERSSQAHNSTCLPAVDFLISAVGLMIMIAGWRFNVDEKELWIGVVPPMLLYLQ
ncbi:MAG: hypothetical protein ACRD63_14065, partial [Pyrinomonadaceae bacterium]